MNSEQMKLYKGVIPEITLKYKKGDVLKCKIRQSSDAVEVLRKFYDEDVFELTETVIVLYLNAANNTIGWMKHSTGGTNQTVVDPKLVVGTALKCGASAILLSHNHPSGQTVPSSNDKDITKMLKNGCDFFNILLIDHIIVTEDSYYSFGDEDEL
ncbi:MAG: JAB domain-containing protein [Paludibacter sp.]